MRLNQYQQPIGPAVERWSPRARPSRTEFAGRYCRLQPINPGLHEADLYTAYMEAPDERDWTYLFDDRPGGEGDFHSYLIRLERSHDPLHFAIVESQSRKALGTDALMRIDPKRGRSFPSE